MSARAAPTGRGGGYGELWRSGSTPRARAVLLGLALAVALFFVLLFASEIAHIWNSPLDDWRSRTLRLCVIGIVVNVGVAGFAVFFAKRSSRPLMLYIFPGVLLNALLVGVTMGFPYY